MDQHLIARLQDRIGQPGRIHGPGRPAAQNARAQQQTRPQQPLTSHPRLRTGTVDCGGRRDRNSRRQISGVMTPGSL